jgi:protein TonB
MLATDRTFMLEEHLTAWRDKRPRVFWLGLAAAFLVHALLIVGIGSARQRTLGTPDGATDAIAVEIVDGATLKDSMEPPTPDTTPPGAQQSTAALPAPQAPQPPQPPPEPPAEPQPPAEAAPPVPPADVAPSALPAKETPTPATDTPELTAEALPAKEEAPSGETAQPRPEATEPKQAAPKKPVEKQQAKQQQKQRTKTSALDLSVPYDGSSSADEAGGSSAVQRPPGITRSGENDEFARNVIRALQKTMPRENARGRVTVRIVLNENGSRADVKLLQSGGDPDLDFNVMFAARQTAYPFPPKNATLVDRTFTVTYIYR